MALVTPVHPRLRGELSIWNKLNIAGSGSSPLTRGTQARYLKARRDRRFIPAYAGNSAEIISRNSNVPVHPRLRGELKELFGDF